MGAPGPAQGAGRRLPEAPCAVPGAAVSTVRVRPGRTVRRAEKVAGSCGVRASRLRGRHRSSQVVRDRQGSSGRRAPRVPAAAAVPAPRRTADLPVTTVPVRAVVPERGRGLLGLRGGTGERRDRRPEGVGGVGGAGDAGAWPARPGGGRRAAARGGGRSGHAEGTGSALVASRPHRTRISPVCAARWTVLCPLGPLLCRWVLRTRCAGRASSGGPAREAAGSGVAEGGTAGHGTAGSGRGSHPLVWRAGSSPREGVPGAQGAGTPGGPRGTGRVPGTAPAGSRPGVERTAAGHGG